MLNKNWRILAGLLVACVPVAMRLAVICNPPFTDEGYYALHSMLAHDAMTNHQNLPPLGPLQIYPILCSFVFFFDVNHLVALRLCDMVIASIMAWQAYRLLTQESNDILSGFSLAFLFALAMNQPIFIQYGFKNSIFIALVFLLFSLRIGLANRLNSHSAWYSCGSMLAVAICFREAFAPFFLVGFFGVLLAYGWKSTLYFISGCLSVACFIVFLVAMNRGGIGNIIDAYSVFSLAAKRSGDLVSNTMLWFGLTVKEITFLMPAGIFLIFGIMVSYRKISLRPVVFWLAISAVPLLEILTKGGYAYHFAVCLLGLSGLSAYICRVCKGYLFKGSISLIFMVCFYFAVPQIPSLDSLSKIFFHRLPLLLQEWPVEVIAGSNYLLMAKAINDVAKEGDTLEISGLNQNMFVLTKLRPPLWKGNHMFDLGMLALGNGWTADRLAEQIKNNKTAIIFVSERPGFGAEILKEAMNLLPEYKKVREIPVDPEKHYGGFSGSVYAKDRDGTGS